MHRAWIKRRFLRKQARRWGKWSWTAKESRRLDKRIRRVCNNTVRKPKGSTPGATSLSWPQEATMNTKGAWNIVTTCHNIECLHGGCIFFCLMQRPMRRSGCYIRLDCFGQPRHLLGPRIPYHRHQMGMHAWSPFPTTKTSKTRQQAVRFKPNSCNIRTPYISPCHSILQYLPIHAGCA